MAEISIPSEVLASQEDGNPIRMASFLFRNMSGLLPQRLSSNGAENDRYGSTTTSFGSPWCLFHIPVSNFYGGQVPMLYTMHCLPLSLIVKPECQRISYDSQCVGCLDPLHNFGS